MVTWTSGSMMRINHGWAWLNDGSGFLRPDPERNVRRTAGEDVAALGPGVCAGASFGQDTVRSRSRMSPSCRYSGPDFDPKSQTKPFIITC